MADQTAFTVEVSRLRVRHAALLAEHDACFLAAVTKGEPLPAKSHELLRLEARLVAAERIA